MVDSTKTYMFQFHDGTVFEVSPNFVEHSDTFSNMLSDIVDDSDKINLPCSNRWSNETYKQLYFSYRKLISNNQNYFTELAKNIEEYNSPHKRSLTDTEKELQFNPDQFQLLFQMLTVSDYLGMNTFIQLFSKIIAHKITGARISGNDQEIYDLLGNPEIELNSEQQQFYKDKIEILETLEKNEAVSM